MPIRLFVICFIIMINVIKKFWMGDIELIKSIWLGFILVGVGTSFVGEFIPEATEQNVSNVLLLLTFYIGYKLILSIFLTIGTWRSAEKYKKKRKKFFWAIVVQVNIVFMIVISILSSIYVFIEPI